MKPSCVLALAGCLAAGHAQASCGTAFCATSNDWLSVTQGVVHGWRVWGQVEYLRQDQLRAGSSKIWGDEVSAHHEEVKTLNRNALLGLEYGFAPGWSASVVLPYSNREHRHIHHHHGTPIPEAWAFDHVGDMRLTLRHQLGNPDGWSGSLQGGLKLPTGRTDVRNGDGDEAERSVQPGTGSTDLLLGAGLVYAPLALPGNAFCHLQLQLPFAERDEYRPGWRASLQAGWLFAVHPRLDLILQGNVLYVKPDRGRNAEPDDSGRIEVSLAPVATYAWSRKLSLYAQVELPLYQNVQGVQLTHDYAVAAGFSLMLN